MNKMQVNNEEDDRRKLFMFHRKGHSKKKHREPIDKNKEFGDATDAVKLLMQDIDEDVGSFVHDEVFTITRNPWLVLLTHYLLNIVNSIQTELMILTRHQFQSLTQWTLKVDFLSSGD